MGKGFLSRREFLKLGSAALLSVLLSHFELEPGLAAAVPKQGRVQATSLNVRDRPAFSGKKVMVLKRDDIVDIVEQVHGGEEGDNNRVWYRLANQSFVYSGWVQPVETRLNPVQTALLPSGILGEITIPYADSYYGINISPSPGPRLYYGSTHWITASAADKRDGSLWYKAIDMATKSIYYVRPQWVHLFSPEEIAPLSPQVLNDEKHIEIYLDRQILLAYERNAPVYMARIASGRRNFESPIGHFRTFHKRPTYHMFGGADEFSIFDLPGVPWDSYITENGVAIHGTYWHNDFGTPHSHGCINLSIPDAKWIYRWTLPSVPSAEPLMLKPGEGTRVRIAQF